MLGLGLADTLANIGLSSAILAIDKGDWGYPFNRSVRRPFATVAQQRHAQGWRGGLVVVAARVISSGGAGWR